MSKHCNRCKSAVSGEMKQTPLISAECEATRQHETIKRLTYAVMLLTILLFGTNLLWVLFGGVI